jgi:EPS-associated MarR family transcriptional regulator
MPILDEELRYRLLKVLHEDPNVSQRELAEILGVSLGKANYCIQALLERGLIKARNFKNSRTKKNYAYLLTPRGVEEKARMTVAFLRRKVTEYEDLEKEIESLREEVQRLQLPVKDTNV